MEVPPIEMRGRGRPVTGTTPTFTAMLMKAWIRMPAPIPKATMAPKALLDFVTSRMMRRKSNR